MGFKNPWQNDANSSGFLGNPWKNKPDASSSPSDHESNQLERQFKPRPADEARVSPAMRLDFFEAMRRNRRNTWILIGSMLILTAGFGYILGWAWDLAFGGLAGAGMHYYASGQIDWATLIMTPSTAGMNVGGALFAGMLVWTLVTLWRADKMVLNMAGAVDAPDRMNQLHNVVEEMALAAGVPKPRVVVIPTKVPNAFATGLRQDKAVVGVTEGLLHHLDRRELQAVVAHEMGHILNGDMRYATILAVMAGVLVFVAEMVLSARHMVYLGGGNNRNRNGGGGHPLFMILMIVIFLIAAIVVPLLARLIQMAISRQREYLADATAVQLTRDPGGMIAALQKIQNLQEPSPRMHSSLEPLFIISPVKMWHKRNRAWFSTHPPLEKRIDRLKALE